MYRNAHATPSTSARAERARRGAQPRAAQRAAPTACACTCCWGNYEGPHHHDVPMERPAAGAAQGQAAGRCCSRRPTRATRTSGRCSAMPAAAGRQDPDPRRARARRLTTSNTQSSWSSGCCASRTSWGASERDGGDLDCGFSTFAGFGAVDPGHRLHEAWPQWPKAHGSRAASSGEIGTVRAFRRSRNPCSPIISLVAQCVRSCARLRPSSR